MSAPPGAIQDGTLRTPTALHVRRRARARPRAPATARPNRAPGDEIFFVASEGALLSGYFANLARTRREGVELSLEGTAVRAGSRLPLVPDHQAKAGAHVRFGQSVTLGVDVRHAGRQWMRGDEANVTEPLAAYTLTSARLGYARHGWEVAGTVTNLFDTRRATFGTFNENRRTGALERFLTPLNARSVKLTVRRALGRSGPGGRKP